MKDRLDTHAGQVAEIRKLIMFLGGVSWTLHQAGRVQGSKGLPDMAFVCGKNFGFVEVKVGRDKLRPEQEQFRREMELRGIPVIVGRASDVFDWIEARKGV